MNKVAHITLAFWVIKIFATTLGETAGDLLSMTLNIGYALSTAILLIMFGISLFYQLSSKKFHPARYWLVILSTSTAGTTLSDFMDRTLGLGYGLGAAVLASCLALVLCVWRYTLGSIQVSNIASRQTEAFYWLAILVSNTLGTALGDYLADDSGLGYLGGAALIALGIALVALLYKLNTVSRIVLFWIAFVLTRPFGATFGDLLTKPVNQGGLDFGTVGASLVLASLLITLIYFCYYKTASKNNPNIRLNNN